MSATPAARTLAVIPARGGSKGVPRKNLKILAGRSLLERAVTAARDATQVTDLVVSTDDDEIAEAAQILGAAVVRRPQRLSNDEAPTPPLVLHALDSVDSDYDNVVLLQPPAPLRTGSDIDAAIRLLITNGHLNSVVSVYSVGDNHPGRMYHMASTGVLEPLEPELEQLRRQDLPPVYHRNGAIYVARTQALRETGQLLTCNVGAYVMNAAWTVNIDTVEDLAIAELVVARWDARPG